jgi:hypothetical protein
MCASEGAGGVLSRLRQDAYVGAQRCWPCTVLNVALLAAAVSLLAWAVAVPAGVAALLGGVLVVWLRGYLVPYTPRITGRLFDLLPGDRRLHSPAPPTPADDRTTDAATGEVTAAATEAELVDDLLTAGVLVAEGDDLSLHPEFRDAWRAEVAGSDADDPAALADALAAAVPWVAEASVVTDDGRRWVRLTDADDSVANETWLSVPAATADLTAVRTLAQWTDLDSRRRTLAAPPLRRFLERCPACDDPLEVTSPRACCGSPRYVAEGIEAVLACPDCDEVVATFGADPGAD